ncbi:MAG TPA: penicillin-binding protein activator LpoB [Candidatus Krumholzibacteria bacterium]|nr:penicillin-binding protein activator LpoB [Candidatus Krumholzibacteria bacterium]
MKSNVGRLRALVVPAAVLLLALGGCSGKQVTRVDVEEQIDLSGEWNDVDSQKVSAALVTQITASPWVEDFIAEKGKKPYLIIGNVRNKTPEHIAVKTFIGDLERNFINGGRVRVVASAEERDQIRGERADQQEFSSEETMKQWGREKGADYMLIGEINAMFDQEKGDQVKYYQVDCYLVDLEDNTKVWAGFEKIKKFVGKGKYKP